MKKHFLFCLAFLFAVMSVWAQTPIYVDASMPDDSGDGLSPATAKKYLKSGITVVGNGGIVNVAAGIYVENGQIVINKNLSVVGAGMATTIIKTNQDTGNSGDTKGWILVNTGFTFNIADLTLNGTGFKVYQAIRHHGSGLINQVKFTEIKYEESGAAYNGAGVDVITTGNIDVTNCQFSNMGRYGVQVWDYPATGTYSGNTYTGKGTGDWLDYAFEIGWGAVITVSNNVISACSGVATVDGSGSSAISVWDDPGTQAVLTGNIMTGNSVGVAIAILTGGSSDPVVTIGAYNFITGSDVGIDVESLYGAVGSPTINITGTSISDCTSGLVIVTGISASNITAESNYWGGTDYFDVVSKISGNVDFDPWMNSTFTELFSTSGGPITWVAKVVSSPGSVTVPVTVTKSTANAISTDAISLKITYNPAILDFTGFTSPISGLTVADSVTDGGVIKISWFSNTPIPLNNNDVIANLNFTSLAGSSLLTLVDDNYGAACEYQEESIQGPYNDIPFPDYYKNGFVTDMSVTFTRDYIANSITAVPAGGNAPYTYSWTGPSGFTAGNVATITPTLYVYGNYVVTITDATLPAGATITGTYYYGPVHNENMDIDYATINAAVSAGTTANEHTISVDPGNYPENVVVNKQLIIKKYAATNPVIDGSGTGIVVTLAANNIRLEGFTIQNSGTDPELNAGVLLASADGCTVINNTIANNVNGIVLMGSNSNTIQSNPISNSARYGIFVGIWSSSTSTLNTITGNTITASGRDGIYLDRNSNGNIMTANSISGTTGTTEDGDFEGNGIYMWRSGSNTVSGNTIFDNATNGIELSASSNNNLASNTITGNLYNGIAIRALTTGTSTLNVVNLNTISSNTLAGILLKSDAAANSGSITNNTISLNPRGINIESSAIDAATWTVTGNKIMGNTAYGVYNNGTGTLTAELNWWGHISGPLCNPYNTCGQGNAVTANVDFVPWCSAPDCSGSPVNPLVTNITKSPQTYYCKIQDAVDDAGTTGETIEVGTGTFYEHVTINKANLILKKAFAATPIIDGSSTGTVVNLTASNVTLTGFTVQHSGTTSFDAGILLSGGVSSCKVESNTITNTQNGIAVLSGSGNTIKLNTLTLDARGISLIATTGNTVETNNISYITEQGIVLDNDTDLGGLGTGSTGNFINTNTVAHMTNDEGIFIGENCNGNSLTGNNVSYAKIGIHLWKSNGQTLTGNTVQYCTVNPSPGYSAVGIRIRNSQNNTITGSTVTLNQKGFEIVANEAPYCTGNHINNNNISSNGSGMDASPSLGNYIVDAENNWWGAASGPYNDPNNTCGTGNSVTAYVDFMPWYKDLARTILTNANGDLLVNNTSKGTYYCKIQDAVDDAGTTGETIEVGTGTFYEHVTINKANLILKKAFAATPIIDGSGTGTVVNLTASNVTITGFTLQNSGTTSFDAGILLGSLSGGVSGCKVESNTITNTQNGIAVLSGSGNTIKLNTLTLDARGILLIATTGNTVETNNITYITEQGIVLDNDTDLGGPGNGSTGNFINTNTVAHMTNDEGIFIGENCNGNSLTGNNVSYAKIGIHLWKSNGQTLTGNTVQYCTVNPSPGYSAVGIRIRNSQNNTITGSTVTLNQKGFEIVANEAPYCTGNHINNNNISSNGSGMDASPSLGNYIVDAENNWWGAASGPYNDPNNTCGTGNSVTAYVDFMPWWTASDGSGLPGTLLVNNVTKGTWYCKIQDAIDDAGTSNEIIEVLTGTFLENININKANLTVKNASSATPIIDGNLTGTVVNLTANSVNFTGFTVQNSGITNLDAGILLSGGVSSCKVESNTITHTQNGIAVLSGSGNTIKLNTLTLDTRGILLIATTGNTVETNNITYITEQGIVLDNDTDLGGPGNGSTGNFINTNTVAHMTNDEGIFIGENCNGNSLTGNNVSYAKIGIQLWKSNGHTLTGNTVQYCTVNPQPGYSAVGIRLRNSQNNTITGSTVTLNQKGFEIVANEAPYCTGNHINNNNISSNGSGMDASPSLGNYIVDAKYNWWGAASGPYNDPNNTCGTGNSVTAYVDFSPWFYQAAMTSLNGVPALTPSAITDISTVTKTPIIVSTTITYPVLTSYDPAILTDAIISTTASTFPAGTKVIEVVFNDHVNPVMTFPVSYDLSTGNSHYLSAILGNPSPYGTPLVAHSGLIVDWKFTIEGATLPVSLPVSIQSVSYLDRAQCNNTLGNPELFNLTYANASLALTTPPAPVCYPAGVAALDFKLTHPTISPVDGQIRSNATIVSDKQLPVGTTIAWTYNPGGIDETNGLFTSTIATNNLLLSEIVTNTQGYLLSPNWFGHTGDITWEFAVGNVTPGTYNFVINAAAQLMNGVLYPYATMAPPLKIVVAGALSVNVLPVTSISTVTSTPVILPVTVAYPDLAAQAVDPTVLTDARISTTTGNFPAGARIFKITYEGGEVLPFTPYVFGAAQNEVFLSDILGGASPLLNHSNLTIDWEIFIDGIIAPVIIPLKVEAIAYVNKAVCYSIMDTELFSLTFANAPQDLTGTYTVCATDPLVVTSTTDFPTINVDSRVKSDALITTDNDFNAGTAIDIFYNNNPYGTYTVLSGGVSTLYVSEMLGGSPNPLASESGAQNEEWKFSITGLDYGVYNITVKPLARLTQTIPVTYTDYPYDLDNATLTKLNCGFSGWVKYNNPTTTKMNNVLVELYQGVNKVYPLTGEPDVKTDADGNYSFPNAGTGTYEIHFSTGKPTGSINATDAAQVNQWWTALYPIEKVRFFAGDVLFSNPSIPHNYIQASDAQRIQGYFVQGLPFDRQPWAFWKAGETINYNNYGQTGYIYPQITIGTGTPVQTGMNYYGQATGDFNRSFIPGSFKAGTENLALVYKESIAVNAATNFELPLYTVAPISVGAASLILNFPSDLVEVTNVSINYGGMLDWAVNGDELRIGWNTQLPVSLAGGEQLLTLSLRSTAAFVQGKEIRFTLTNDILNELADDYYEVIPDAVLAIGVAASSTYGIGEPTDVEKISLSNHPNPFRDYTNITYALPFAGRVTIEVYNILGEKISTLADAYQSTGNYSVEYFTSSLETGIYTVTLKLQGDNETLLRTVKIVRTK